MTDMSARNTAQISSAIAVSASQGTALHSTLTRTIAGINSTMIASVALKANEAQHLWLGGCRDHGGNCWRDQCLNGVELDTARPYFYKRTNYRMRTLVAGFFRLNMWLIDSGNWAHMSVGSSESYLKLHLHATNSEHCTTSPHVPYTRSLCASRLFWLAPGLILKSPDASLDSPPPLGCNRIGLAGCAASSAPSFHPSLDVLR